jgi:hypothetical protein
MPLNSLEESETTKEATQVLLKVSKVISFSTIRGCRACCLDQCRTGKTPNDLLNSCKVWFSSCQLTQTPVESYA